MAIDPAAQALLPFETYVGGIERATAELAAHCRQTWLGADVPTCPDWTLLDLVAHQGMVHRWATAALRRDRDAMGNAASMETEGRTSADPVVWLEHGSATLVDQLRAAPEDLDALVFLKEGPPARLFWARRQCHETTVHALDALSAVLERPLTAGDVSHDADLAADGIDELLVGFWQRGKAGIRSTQGYAVRVLPDDAPLSWVVTASEQPVRTRRVAPSEATGVDATLSGSAVDLHLALWNRGGAPNDPDGALDRFREGGAITW